MYSLSDTHDSKKSRKSCNRRYVSIKISAVSLDATREIETLHLIQNANESHEGYPFIRTPIDHFELSGPQGIHSCLVYEPMRETLAQHQSRFPRQRLTVPIFKLYIHLILKALDYLHSECRLIHTGNSPGLLFSSG